MRANHEPKAWHLCRFGLPTRPTAGNLSRNIFRVQLDMVPRRLGRRLSVRATRGASSLPKRLGRPPRQAVDRLDDISQEKRLENHLKVQDALAHEVLDAAGAASAVRVLRQNNTRVHACDTEVAELNLRRSPIGQVPLASSPRDRRQC